MMQGTQYDVMVDIQSSCSTSLNSRNSGSKKYENTYQLQIDMVDNSETVTKNMDKSLMHDPELFAIQSRRVLNLFHWYEFADRPDIENDLINAKAHERDLVLFNSEVDNIPTLLQHYLQARDEMNSNLPPYEKIVPCDDKNKVDESILYVSQSTIPDAGQGLFTSQCIKQGQILCYYTGHRHDNVSQRNLADKSYLLRLRNGYPSSSRMNDGFVDARPCLDVKARYINDPSARTGDDESHDMNVKFEHIEKPYIWYAKVVATRDINAGEELFLSYGPRYWIK